MRGQAKLLVRKSFGKKPPTQWDFGSKPLVLLGLTNLITMGRKL